MNNKERLFYIGVALSSFALFVFFYYISQSTPLSGDDWGYATNGMNGGAVNMTIQFYKSWSGRIISEFWGFFVAPKKWLWNILNPLIFTSIYLLILRLSSNKKRISSFALLLFLMFSVSEYLRMETYSWIMGTTFVIGLLLALIYFALVNRYIFGVIRNKNIIIIVSTIVCFMIGLTSENIAAIMIVAVALIMIYRFVEFKVIDRIFVSNIVASILGFVVIRISPGSAYRLVTEHNSWSQLSFFEKISGQWENFVRFTFIDNKYLIFTLAVVIIALLISKGIKWIKKNYLITGLTVLTQGYALILSCANFLIVKLNFEFLSGLFKADAIINIVLYICYTIGTIVVIFSLIEDEKNKFKAIFFLIIGGACNVVMLYSPIFGARSSLFFVYFSFITILLLFNEIDYNDKIDYVVCLVLLVLVTYRGRGWLYKYQQVRQIEIIRQSEIEYYKVHPEEDAWICRMPPLSIHSADVEDWDTYHQETFKEYYGLSPEQKLIFYWKDSYD